MGRYYPMDSDNSAVHIARKEQTMRCVDCEKHSFVANTHWCDATKKPKRVSDEDAHKDVPCKRGKLKGADDE